MENQVQKRALTSQDTTSSQLSLAMFNDLLPLEKPISDSPADIGFRRNRAFLDIYSLSVASRRAMDATFLTVAQDPEIRQRYDVDLGYLKWLMKYTSDNHTHLRGIFRDLQKSAIESEGVSDTEAWGSIPLMGAIAIKGGRVIFEIDERLQRLIKDPVHWNFFSLRISTSFKSGYARTLYEHLLGYMDEGVTDWLSLDEVRKWTDATTKAFDEYKQLKRAVLDPAVDQINEVSKLSVKYQTTNVPGSKRVGGIRFLISKKSDAEEGPQSLLGSKALYDTLRDEFGLSPANFDELTENRHAWTDEWIRHAIDFTRFNIERGRVKKSVPGYLMNALRNNLRVGTAEKEVANQLLLEQVKLEAAKQEESKVSKINDASVARSNKEIDDSILAGLAEFGRMSEPERQEHILSFKSTLSAKLAARKENVDLLTLDEKGIVTNTFVEKTFGQHVFDRVCKPKLKKATSKSSQRTLV